MKNPYRIYLDSSDYFNIANNMLKYKEIIDFLKRQTVAGKIVIPFSCVTVFEFIQPCNECYWEERLARARLIKELCGMNCFRYISDLKKNDNAYSNAGMWIPNEIVRNVLCVKNIIRIIRKNISESYNDVKIDDRQLARIIRLNKDSFKKDLKYIFPQKLFDDDLLPKYLENKITARIVDAQLIKCISDVENFFINGFKVYGFGDIFIRILHNFSESLHNLINAIIENGEIKNNIQFINSYIKSNNKLKKLVPEYLCCIISAFLKYKLKNKNNLHLQNSDAGDILHGLYIPYSHLWRGDKHFCDILIRDNIKFSERIVKRLIDLPEKIEELISNGKIKI